ncbi:unnamed protein product, partial [Adineta steineri]
SQQQTRGNSYENSKFQKNHNEQGNNDNTYAGGYNRGGIPSSQPQSSSTGVYRPPHMQNRMNVPNGNYGNNGNMSGGGYRGSANAGQPNPQQNYSNNYAGGKGSFNISANSLYRRYIKSYVAVFKGTTEAAYLKGNQQWKNLKATDIENIEREIHRLTLEQKLKQPIFIYIVTTTDTTNKTDDTNTSASNSSSLKKLSNTTTVNYFS